MTEKTPAEQLRAAAAKLRETATDTTPGPWFIGDCSVYPRWIMSSGKTEPESGYPVDVARITSDEADAFEISEPDWQWTAFASPALAEPLAAWLEEAAGQADMNEARAPRHRVDLTEALAVARVILGTPAAVDPIEEIDEDAAAHVLWHHGLTGGWEPIDYIAQLLDAIAIAPDRHRARLAEVYPGHVAAMGLIRQDDGLHRLQVIAKRRLVTPVGVAGEASGG